MHLCINYKKSREVLFIPYLEGSYFVAAGAGGLGSFADLDPDPGPVQGTGSRMGGPGLHRPSAWSWGQCVRQHY